MLFTQEPAGARTADHAIQLDRLSPSRTLIGRRSRIRHYRERVLAGRQRLRNHPFSRSTSSEYGLPVFSLEIVPNIVRKIRPPP
jgi:hypothetical protein